MAFTSGSCKEKPLFCGNDSKILKNKIRHVTSLPGIRNPKPRRICRSFRFPVMNRGSAPSFPHTSPSLLRIGSPNKPVSVKNPFSLQFVIQS